MFDHIESFVSDIYHGQDKRPRGWMALDESKDILDELRATCCYDVPEDITPELFAYFWNQEVEKDLYPHVMRFSDEEIAALHRALKMLGAALEGWTADGIRPPYSVETVDSLLDRITKELERS